MELWEIFKESGSIYSGYVVAFLLLSFIVGLKNAKAGLLKKLFYIPARKSKTGAIQLGGLPVFIGVATSLCFFLNENISTDLGITNLSIFFLITSLILVFHGYLDDKIELRPIVKLSGQIFICFSFALYTSLVLESHYYSIITFLCVFIFSIATMNGNNLLDGVDTLCLKIGLVNLASFYFLGELFGLPITKGLALIGVGPLLAFWYFNKEPAKVHLGEVGSSFLGYFYLFLSMCMFHEQIQTSKSGYIPIAFTCIAPLMLMSVELGVSFLRRLIAGRSPFSGDKLHIHHLLVYKYNYTPTKCANFVAFIYFVDMASTCFFVYNNDPLWGVGFSILFKLMFYFGLGGKFWFKDQDLNFSKTGLIQFIRKKDVTLINFSIADKLDFEVYDDDEEDTEEDDPAA